MADVRVTQLIVEAMSDTPDVRVTQLIVEAMILDPDFAPPSPPSNPSATATGETTITVEWADVMDETGYRVERSADGSTGWTDVSGNLPPDTVSWGDTGLSPNTEYFYRVIAFNDNGDSSPSAVVSATTDGGSGDMFCCDCALTSDPFDPGF